MGRDGGGTSSAGAKGRSTGHCQAGLGGHQLWVLGKRPLGLNELPVCARKTKGKEQAGLASDAAEREREGERKKENLFLLVILQTCPKFKISLNSMPHNSISTLK